MTKQEQDQAGGPPIKAGVSEVLLDTLTADHDALLDRMQTPEARMGMRRAFDASTEALGGAAVAAIASRSGSQGASNR